MPLDQLNIAQPQPANMLLQAMGMKDRMQRTQLARESGQLQREAFEFNRMKQGLAMGNEHLPTLEKDEYPKYIKWLKDIGAPYELLPEDVSDWSDDKFETLKQQIYMGAKQVGQMNMEQLKAFQKEAQAQRDQQRKIELKKTPGPATTAMAKFIQDNPNATAEELAAFQQKLKGKGIRILPDGTVEIGGAQDLGIATKNKLQKEVVDLSGQLQQISNLEDSAFTDVLTLQGKIFQKGLRLADYLKVDIGEENKEYLGKARVFIENIEKVFNSYRKEITGAQAAMKEIEMLRTSILNKKLTPTEFEHSIKSFKNAVLRGLRLKRMLLAQGISGKNLPQQLDTLYSSEGDVPDSEMDRRGDELLADGLSETEVIEKLREEGYDL